MSGGFPNLGGACNGTDIGTTSASSIGTAVTSGNNSPGAYTQIIASSAIDCSFIEIALTNSVPNSFQYAVDIAIGGAGSEQVIVSHMTAYTNAGNTYTFPINIPAGTRIAARSAASNGTDAINVKLNLYGSAFSEVDGCSGVDGIGFVGGTCHGTSVTAGASNAKGSYAQLVASSAVDYGGLAVAVDPLSTSTAQFEFLIDIAVGAAASEVVIIPNLSVHGASPAYFPFVFALVPIEIPAGTRIAARAQSTKSTTQTIGVTVYGVYK